MGEIDWDNLPTIRPKAAGYGSSAVLRTVLYDEVEEQPDFISSGLLFGKGTKICRKHPEEELKVLWKREWEGTNSMEQTQNAWIPVYGCPKCRIPAYGPIPYAS